MRFPRLTLLLPLFARALSWWTGNLAHCVPPRLRRALRIPVVQVTGGHAVLLASSGEELERLPLGSLAPGPPRGAGRVLIGADHVYRQPLDIPLCAPWDLERVVGYELTRLTPFPPEGIVFRCRPAQLAAGRLRVEACILRRPVLDLAHAAATAFGLSEYQVSAVLDDGGAIPIETRRDKATSRMRWIGIGTAVAVAAAWLWALSQWAEHWRTEADSARRAFAANRAAMASVQAQRSRLEYEMAALGNIAREHAGRSELRILAALASQLPDDAWVNDLSIRAGEVRLDGQARDATAILGRLAAEQNFVDVRFGAPVTRGTGEATERFDVSLRWRGVP